MKNKFPKILAIFKNKYYFYCLAKLKIKFHFFDIILKSWYIYFITDRKNPVLPILAKNCPQLAISTQNAQKWGVFHIFIETISL